MKKLIALITLLALFGSPALLAKDSYPKKGRHNSKETSPGVASKAGQALQDKKASKREKSLAGSDLSQARHKSKNKGRK